VHYGFFPSLPLNAALHETWTQINVICYHKQLQVLVENIHGEDTAKIALKCFM